MHLLPREPLIFRGFFFVRHGLAVVGMHYPRMTRERIHAICVEVNAAPLRTYARQYGILVNVGIFLRMGYAAIYVACCKGLSSGPGHSVVRHTLKAT